MKAKLVELTLTNGLPLEHMRLGPSSEATIQAVIGPEPGEGEELFDFSVKVGGLTRVDAGQQGYVWSGQTLLLATFDSGKVRQAVWDVLANVKGEDWNALVAQLREHMRWEFDAS